MCKEEVFFLFEQFHKITCPDIKLEILLDNQHILFLQIPPQLEIHKTTQSSSMNTFLVTSNKKCS